MTLLEDMAVLVLAERIRAGLSFQAGMVVEVPRAGQLAVKVTATSEMIERAADVALQRHENGFWELQKHASANPPVPAKK